jgi:hypothetical protein
LETLSSESEFENSIINKNIEKNTNKGSIFAKKEEEKISLK